MAAQILFIQSGGGENVHDEWDDKLVASLKRELGPDVEVRYPRMPNEDDPKYAAWKPAILGEIAKLDDGAILVGHSIGGTMLIHALAEQSNKIPPLDGEGQGRGEFRDPLYRWRRHPHHGARQHRLGDGALAPSPIEGEEFRPGAIILISAPFVGEGGWPSDDIEAKADLGAWLPEGVPVHLFHGSEDETAPPEHAELYARAIPEAQVHRLPGRDHQLNNDLKEVVEVVRAVTAEAEAAN
jgi:hypothetical protein